VACPICHKIVSAHMGSLARHIGSPHNPDQVNCPRCGKRAFSKYRLPSHSVRVRGNPKEEFVSEKCGKKFTHRGQLEFHKNHSHPVAELECDNCTTRVMHEGASTHPKNCDPSMPKSVVCNICGKMVAHHPMKKKRGEISGIFVSIWRGFRETPSSLGDMGVSKFPTLLRNPTISQGNTPPSQRGNKSPESFFIGSSLSL
jgi:DNA-directed RNA polymerase subunit RPC12/RpoP